MLPSPSGGGAGGGGPNNVMIVGGGASGMLAAISARRMGADVTLLERNPRIGKKILVTGNGRCNFTNLHAGSCHYHGGNPEFIHGAFAEFGVQRTIGFFEKLGIAHKVEEGGKVYPMSDQASSVLDVLRYELDEIGVRVRCNARVENIAVRKRNFKIDLENGEALTCDRVILAAGGRAMPSTGSDGNGFELTKRLGHTVVDPFPGLVQLKLEGGFFRQIEGVRIMGTAELICDNRPVAEDRGDILFANYGVSGPPILQLSRKAGELLREGRKPILKIAVIGGMSQADLDRTLAQRFENSPGKTAEFGLVGLVNKRLIRVLLKAAGIEDLRCPVGDLTPEDRKSIAAILTDWRFAIKGTRSWQNAQVTAGGVETDEIDPKTLESRRVKGLFFSGEIVDIDGQCGGFNLQWAWSSGYVAGRNAAL